jgi:hypothetical protein
MMVAYISGPNAYSLPLHSTITSPLDKPCFTKKYLRPADSQFLNNFLLAVHIASPLKMFTAISLRSHLSYFIGFMDVL